MTSLISTGLFGVAAKLEFARLQSRLMDVDPRAIQRECLASWLNANVNDTRMRQVLEMLVRVTTFTNDPQHQSAGAAIEHTIAVDLDRAGRISNIYVVSATRKLSAIC